VRRIYLAELEEFDAMVGAVVDALVAAGRWDGNTFLVLAADHGDMQLLHQLFYKMLPYDASARVPLVFASPALAGLGARTVAQPAQLLDIFPTLLDMAGAAVPSYADGYSLRPFLAGATNDPSRPQFVAFQNHDEDISASWFAVSNGTHKLVQYGSGAQVAPQLFNLTADGGEAVNLYNTSDAARAAEASLDAQLRSLIDYPAVGQAVADYQLALFKKWASLQTDWKKEIASANVRWQAAFAAHPAEALAAAEAFIAQSPPALIRPCNGALVNNV
jgi:arylsulfatase K